MSGSLRMYLSNHEQSARPSAFAEATADRRSAKREGWSTSSGRAVRHSTARQDLSPSARRHRLREHGRRWLRVWRARNPSRRVNLRLVEALVDEELSDDRIEPAAILSDQPPRFPVTLVGDAPNLFVHGVEEAFRDSGQTGIALRRQHGKRPDALGHPPSTDHRTSNARHHLEIALGSGCHDV